MKKLLLSVAAAALFSSAGAALACEMNDGDDSASNSMPMEMAQTKPAALTCDGGTCAMKPARISNASSTKPDSTKAIKVVKAKPLTVASDQKSN